MRTIYVLIATFLTIWLQAQQPLNRDPQNIVDPNGFMRVLAPPSRVEGSVNMFENWQRGDVYLSQGKLAESVILNYDVLHHMLSVQVEGKEYSLNPVAIDSIKVLNTPWVLVNPIIFEEVYSDVLLLRIYQSAHTSMFRKTTVEVIKPNYNEILNVGSRNFQINQDFTYLIKHHQTNQIKEFNGKRKELKEWEHGSKILSFVKQQHLDLKNETDLVKIVEYHDELTY